MSRRRETASVFIISFLVALLVIPAATTAVPTLTSEHYTVKYSVLGHIIYLSIQPSLIGYYGNLSTTIKSDSDWANLVTPEAVQPIADALRSITNGRSNSDEYYADAVLSLVHQIPYNITGPKYPVETLVDNAGDCGALSLFAASILKAGGLDVILIKYTGIDPSHMNVGVCLPNRPAYHSLLMIPTSFEYNNKIYWTAEATSSKDWKVGDQSSTLSGAKPTFISIDNRNQSSPGPISVGVDKVQTIVPITVNVSTEPADSQQNRSLVISGTIPPESSNNDVSLYINKNGTYVDYFQTTADINGTYLYTWNFTSDGTYYVTASWSGNATVAGIDSETLVVFVGPQSLVQFTSDTYNYIIARGIGNPIKPNIGVNNFLSIPLQTNISLSYNFIVLNTGSIASDVATQTITKPASPQINIVNGHTVQLIPRPARTIVIPTAIPRGMEALRLPADFNRTINRNFALVIQKESNGHYSLDAKGLNDYDVSDMQQKSSNTTIVNATQAIQPDTWYRVTNTISDTGIDTNLQTQNETSLLNYSAPHDIEDSNQFALLIANNVDSAIVLKNITVNEVNTMPSIEPTKVASESSPFTLPFLYGALAVMVGFAASLLYAYKKRRVVCRIV